MKRKIATTVAIAAIALIGLSLARAQTGGSGTIVLKVPADANVVIGGMKTLQRGTVRTFYTPELAPGYKYQYEVTVTWKEGGKERKKSEWVNVTPGKITNLDWTVAGKDLEKKRDDVRKVDVKDRKDDVKKKDTVKDKKDTVKDKKDDAKKVDVKIKKDDVKKKDVVKDKKDDIKKDDARKDDAKDKKDAVKDKKADVKKADEKEFKQLFNGKDMSGFKEVTSAKDGKSPFEVMDGVIHVSGNPSGYFYTEGKYRNFILRFDWKFLKDGNSGLLVHIQEPHKVWPKSIEVQGMQKDHGNIFAIGGAKGSFKKDAAAQKEAIKMGEWNTTEVISQDGKLTAKVNGREVSSGEGELKEGPLGWQSEGAPLQFKSIRIKTLD